MSFAERKIISRIPKPEARLFLLLPTLTIYPNIVMIITFVHYAKNVIISTMLNIEKKQDKGVLTQLSGTDYIECDQKQRSNRYGTGIVPAT